MAPMMDTCPRRMQEIGPWEYSEGLDGFSEDRTCTFCGSLDPGYFMDLIESGAAYDPTDKNYKIYLTAVPNPIAGKMSWTGGGCNTPIPEDDPNCKWTEDLTDEEIEICRRDGAMVERFYRRGGDPKPRTRWERFGIAPATIQRKFYYQHLSVEQQKRFIELMNEGKLRLTTMPFFAARKETGDAHH